MFVNNKSRKVRNAFLIAEILGTFALAYVVLNVATAKPNSCIKYFGLPIGFNVMDMAFCFGEYSGVAFNQQLQCKLQL